MDDDADEGQEGVIVRQRDSSDATVGYYGYCCWSYCCPRCYNYCDAGASRYHSDCCCTACCSRERRCTAGTSQHRIHRYWCDFAAVVADDEATAASLGCCYHYAVVACDSCSGDEVTSMMAEREGWILGSHVSMPAGDFGTT